MEHENRVVVLIDMDCFYCQVEEKLDPELQGKPIAVVQYNPWKGGGIIAVNYVARAMGVTRHMRGDEAKEKCPEIQLPSVPCQRGKADITKYRDAGKEVAKVLQKFTPLLERASIDEAYLDITAPVQERLKTLNAQAINTDLIPDTFALGYDTIEEFVSDIHRGGSESIEFDYDHSQRLLVGSVIVSEVRAAVLRDTGYTCSAGIAHNKILAKLVCGMNKPNKQTVLPKHSIDILYRTLPLKKVKHLGGKFGDTVCELLGITNMGELQRFTEKELQARFDEKNGTWLFNIARGIDLDPVQARFNPKSIGCCKQFRGKSALLDLESLRKWLKDLGDEIEDRLEKDALENNRAPKQMVVSFSMQLADGRDTSSSRSYNFVADDELCGDLFTGKALELILESSEGVKVKDEEANRKLKAPIKFLGISVGKFEDNSESKKTKKINYYFGAGSSNAKPKINNEKEIDKIQKQNDGKEYILNRFFQATDKAQTNADKIETNKFPSQDQAVRREESIRETKLEAQPVIESTLPKQESFFARFLNRDISKTTNTEVNSENKSKLRPTTPLCNVVNCGEDSVSNDTAYSSSTINMEINRSIALFDDDPQDVSRVSSMRDLINKSTVCEENDDIIDAKSINNERIGRNSSPKNKSVVSLQRKNFNTDKASNERTENAEPSFETFQCTECGKSIRMDMFDTHADYHLALQLREEERRSVRDGNKSKFVAKIAADKEKVKKKDNNVKNETISSINDFFIKVDSRTPTETCSECGKKVPLEKFAEHLDFHEAQKLNRELNKRSAPRHLGGNSVKRKKSMSPLKKPKMPCHSKSIDSFFR